MCSVCSNSLFTQTVHMYGHYSQVVSQGLINIMFDILRIYFYEITWLYITLLVNVEVNYHICVLTAMINKILNRSWK